jgi:hypothetical protein
VTATLVLPLIRRRYRLHPADRENLLYFRTKFWKEKIIEVAIRLRPFVSADYSKVEAIIPNSNLEADLRYDERSRDPKCKFKQFVAEDNGYIFAYAWYEQLTEIYDPQEFMIQPVVVRPNSMSLYLMISANISLPQYEPLFQ